MADDPRTHRFRHDGPMSTVIGVRVEIEPDDHDDPPEEVAEAVDALLLDEIDRLERVFSAFDPASDLSRWRRGEEPPTPELADLLVVALGWQTRTGGRFNPASGELTARWRRAEAEGREPDEAELAALAHAVAEPRYGLVDGVPTPTGDCRELNLNALAKGHIVDRAVAAAMERLRPSSLVVAAGGDLRVAGTRARPVAIENPIRPYDNEPPLAVIELTDGAMAGSGQARRGFRVGDRRLGHLLDPRTGHPVEGPAGVTVAAADAATADVVATAASVAAAERPEAAVDLVADVDGVALIVVERDGRVVADPRWIERFGPIGPARTRPGRDGAPGR